MCYCFPVLISVVIVSPLVLLSSSHTASHALFLSRLSEEVELLEDEMRRREGGVEVESDVEMEKAL